MIAALVLCSVVILVGLAIAVWLDTILDGDNEDE